MSQDRSNKGSGTKSAYERPSVTTLEEADVAASLGPVRLSREEEAIQGHTQTTAPVPGRRQRR